MKLSAIVIVKNEEKMIADCLDSLSFCDEIIVVDSGSTDRTQEIGQRMGAKIVEINTNDFSKMRNAGLTKAKGKWVLYIDADERVSSSLSHQILSVVESKKSEYTSYKVQRQNFYFGKHPWPVIESMERLFEKSQLKGWYGALHESPTITGLAGQLSGYLNHYTHRDLSSMVSKTILWSKIEAELRFKANHPKMSWWRFPRVMIPTFFHYYIGQKGYTVGTVGIIESIYQTFSIFITYAELWQLQKQQENTSKKATSRT